MRTRMSRSSSVLLAFSCLAFLVFLIVFTPASPFEWDEVLFLRALGDYDAAANSPHMPGYPLFVLLTRFFHLLITDEVLAVQLCSALFGMLLIPAMFFLARELDLDFVESATSALVMSATPCLLWYAPVGLSDVPGTTLGVLAAYMVIRSARAESGWLAALTGVVAAASIGVRSQNVYLALILGLAFVVLCLRSRRIRPLLLSGLSFVATSTAIWVPAILITGPDRWWKAFLWQVAWVQSEREQGLAIPYARWSWIADGWLISPFGNSFVAAVFWIAVGAGCTASWIRGKRGVVVFSLCAGVGSLLMSAWSLDLRNGPRYILSSLPFLCVLATGMLSRMQRRSLRFLGAGLLFSYGVTAVLWVLPILRLRSEEPSPVWQALTWIKESYSQNEVVVCFEPKVMPHVDWVLGRSGYQTVQLSPESDTVPDGRTELRVESNLRDVPPDAVFFKEWPSDRLKAMVPGRYLRCTVIDRHPQQERR
jgi:hypothetical protein